MIDKCCEEAEIWGLENAEVDVEVRALEFTWEL
jgi:hypothetical protein